jgi:uncharacterized protein YbaA (DUF1428 family)
MNYVDGFVTPVPTAKREAYIEHARKAAPILREHGALTVVECWGDDVPAGKLTSFPLAVKSEPDETVVLSWITWASKAARDAGWQKIMADPRMQAETMTPPFDGKRLIYGGFQVVLQQP